MTPERYQQVNRLLDEVLELDPAERTSYLASVCAEDEELRLEVESLLLAHGQAENFIEAPAAGEVAELLDERETGEMVGRTLGHYQLHALIGAGGMGKVYRATDTRLEREVAVKILPPHLTHYAEALRRFEREAKAVAALSHANVCAIHDFGNEQGISYAVMELLAGETLRERFGRGALPWPEVAQIGAAVADGLAAAHAKGIIHRDLKPENIFLTSEGQVKVLDFGIARIKRVAAPDSETGMATLTETTTPGTLIGTIGYVSPEQVRGESADVPSDIFSLGCVLYEMVSGQRPFGRGNSMETLAAILKEEPPGLARLNKAIPPPVERVIHHCLGKRPEERYQAAAELASDLRGLLGQNGASLVAPALTRPRLHLAGWVGTAVAVLLIGVLAWWYLTSRRGDVIDSLAIMPLVSNDKEVDYLSDGITDGIINALSQLPNLRVMARSTVFTYKGREIDPRRVGEELKVRAVFNGKLSQRDDVLFINAELVDAADGSRLWGEQYSRKLTDIMNVETDLARKISDRLRLTLTGDDRQRLARQYTDNPEAFKLYLSGRHHLTIWSEESFKKARALFMQAIDVDPNYALAWTGLADAYYSMSNIYLPSQDAMPKSREAAERALALDGSLPEAHYALATVKAFYDWDWQAAERAFQRAMELNPGYKPVHPNYGVHLMITGRTEASLAELQRLRESDPLSLSIAVASINPLHFAPSSSRQTERAIAAYQKIIALDPEFPPAHYSLGIAYEQKRMFGDSIRELEKTRQLDDAPYVLGPLGHSYATAGRTGEALKILDVLRERSKRENVLAFSVAEVYAGLGDKDRTFEWLDKSVQQKEEAILLIGVDPRFDNLRSDPRFADVLRRLNLAQ